jgi:hypothetical protein
MKVIVFYDRMTVHRKRFLVNKTNRCTEFQFYWYYYSACFGQPFCSSSGVLSCTSVLVHFIQSWWLFATRSKQSQPHKIYQSRCTTKNSWWWTERLSETCRVVIPIKLEFSASVGFIQKEIYSVFNFWNIIWRIYKIHFLYYEKHPNWAPLKPAN